MLSGVVRVLLFFRLEGFAMNILEAIKLATNGNLIRPSRWSGKGMACYIRDGVICCQNPFWPDEEMEMQTKVEDITGEWEVVDKELIIQEKIHVMKKCLE